MTREITLLLWTAPAWVWLLPIWSLLLVALWAFSLYIRARGRADAYEAQLEDDWQPAPRPRGGPDATITDAELARLIHDAAWLADLELIAAESEEIDRWLALKPYRHTRRTLAEPWAIARLEP